MVSEVSFSSEGLQPARIGEAGEKKHLPLHCAPNGAVSVLEHNFYKSLYVKLWWRNKSWKKNVKNHHLTSVLWVDQQEMCTQQSLLHLHSNFNKLISVPFLSPLPWETTCMSMLEALPIQLCVILVCEHDFNSDAPWISNMAAKGQLL